MNFNLLLLIKFKDIGRILWKFLVLIFLLLSVLLIVAHKSDNAVAEKINKVGLQITGPVMYVLEFPARMIHRAYTYVYDVSRVFADNRALQEENKQMLYLQNKVHTLEVENRLMAQLLNYSPPPEATFISAKVIAESGDDFTHALIIYVGDAEVKKGQVVLASESVIGRIDSVGGKYAKVILINDISSKIPVVIERTRARGILSGNNTSLPQLIFTKSTADIQEGDLVVTSGVGGMFPSGLPVGFINSIRGSEIDVETISELDRVEYVRVVDYGLFAETEDVSALMDDNKDE